MMLDVAPDQVYAVVVGIDHYGYGPDWTLAGPARDAQRFADWLLGQGVPLKNIAVFLSESSWQEPEIKAWKARLRDEISERLATADRISSYFAAELFPKLRTLRRQPCALLVYWGGHGVLDDREWRQYLLTTDAEPNNPKCICVQHMLRAAACRSMEHVQKQVLIFDVCATSFGSLGETNQPMVVALSGTGEFALATTQYHIYAASKGQQTKDDKEKQRGVFSALFLQALANQNSCTLADVEAAFKAIEHHPELEDQYPVLRKDGYSVDHRGRANPPLSSLARDLLSVTAGLRLNPKSTQRAYLRSLPSSGRSVTGTDLQAYIKDLDDTRPEFDDAAPPLIEFAKRLADICNKPELAQWARANAPDGTYMLLEGKLDAELRVAQRPHADLFVLMEQRDSAAIQWWLETPDDRSDTQRMTIACAPGNPLPTLQEHLPDIIDTALGYIYDNQDLRIGFIVPTELLIAGFENIIVNSETGDRRPLIAGYQVLYHWAEPLTVSNLHPRFVSRRRETQLAISNYITNGGSARLVWLNAGSADGANPKFYDATAQQIGTPGPVCLALEHVSSDSEDTRIHSLAASLRAGIPCLLWLPQPDDPGQSEIRRAKVQRSFDRHELARAPLRVPHEQANDYEMPTIEGLGIVWDLPEYLPKAARHQHRFHDPS
ncbi:hypothetical protein VL15_07465 [Burkholderia cepacia]|uniref:Caspase family protein n=1 Tax=Burkholderia cepacia TaxID=292 RepID=A0A0J5XDP8_BURCE|nr:caspase family protein [Burkholderia cepacia]KML60937.1 hypothetical protein VL15_07465 [Burkholderia cepacia]